MVPPKLRANLAALAQCKSDLAERIPWPVSSEHVSVLPDGSCAYRIQDAEYPLSLDAETVAQALGDLTAAQGKPVVLFGIGLGEMLEALLQGGAATVIAWERDPWLLRMCLTRSDYSAAIASGKLQLRLCADLLPLCENPPAGAVAVGHPLLMQIYRNERRVFEEGLREARALVLAGTLFVDDLADSLFEQGYSVFTWEAERLSAEELALICKTVQPKLIAAINYTQGLAKMCHAHGVPLLVWEVDPCTDALRPEPQTRGVRICTYRALNVPLFERAGFADVRYVPLASNPQKRFAPALSVEQRAHYQAPISFVGSSMVRQAEAMRRRFLAACPNPESAKTRLEQVLSAQREDFSTYRVPQLLEAAFAQDWEPLRHQLKHEHPTLLVAEIAAAEKRIIYLSTLAPLGAHVWGDDGWRAVEPTGIAYRGAAGHRDELNKIYAATAINVDINRLYQMDIVPMRVFDVLCCGGFLVAEHSAALAQLFEIGVELESYRDLPELQQKVVYYREHPLKAQAIAAAGAKAVQARHTIQQRITEMMTPWPP